jgi:hypothetical protein
MASGLPFATTTSVRYLNLVAYLRLGTIIPGERRSSRRSVNDPKRTGC